MNKEYKPITNLWKDSEGYRYFGTLKLSSKIKYDGDDFIPLWEWVEQLQQENKQLKDKLSKIETLIINHNCDTGDIYYKYNSKFLKSELKQRILEIVYEQGSGSDE